MRNFYKILALGLLAASSVGAMESSDNLATQSSNVGGRIVYKELPQRKDFIKTIFSTSCIIDYGSYLEKDKTLYSLNRLPDSLVIGGFNPSTETAFLGVLDPDLLSKFDMDGLYPGEKILLGDFKTNLKGLLKTDPSQVQLHFHNFQQKNNDHQKILSFVNKLGASDIVNIIKVV